MGCFSVATCAVILGVSFPDKFTVTQCSMLEPFPNYIAMFCYRYMKCRREN
jgi:hypothetical protein